MQTRTMNVNVTIDPSDLQAILVSLTGSGWVPALFEARQKVLEIAGLLGKIILPAVSNKFPYEVNRSRSCLGDIFFRGEDVYFIIVRLQDESQDKALSIAFDILSGRYGVGTEIGIITNDLCGAEQKLKLFSDTFQNCIISSLDGRKTRHMRFDWQEGTVGTRLLDQIKNDLEDGATIKFVEPDITDERLLASGVLLNEVNRETLIEISRAGRVRAHDIRKIKKQDTEKPILELKQYGLLSVEYIVECIKSSTPLVRLVSKVQLEDSNVGDLVCASCDRHYREENLCETYSVSLLGKKLCTSSHWMTILVTDELLKAGIPKNAILWNLSEAGEEVDILAEFMGEVWIFELKDREFGAGDAYSFNYRQIRYKATKAFIVTTDKVSKDAKRVFEDLGRSKTGYVVPMVYIEGFQFLRDSIVTEVFSASLRYANNKISPLSFSSGYDLQPIIAEKFGKPA